MSKSYGPYFGLTSDRERTRTILRSQTLIREKLRRLKARRFNCLVFNISDDNSNNEKETREINDKIRHKAAMSCPK
jgi:hypothetical protein